jgi:hypothetical protein
MKTAIVAAVCVSLLAFDSLHTAHGMGVMVAATGPGNVTCDEFRKLGPAKREQALAWAQGYAAARNLYADTSNGEENRQISLLDHWREFNKRVERFCSDKTNPYLYRKFINDAADTVLEEMQADKKFRSRL